MKKRITGKIVVDPNVMVGKPVIAGTRIPVYLVLDLLADGLEPKEIIKNYYPQLTLKDIQAAIKYGAKVVENEEIVFVENKKAPREAILG